jgi:RHS repeat-associated protein
MLMMQPGYNYDSTIYYRARYYDPTIGRFLSEDPIRFWGGVDFYKYVDNSPTNMTDPSGKLPIHGNWCGPNWTGGRIEQYDPGHDKSGIDGPWPYYNGPMITQIQFAEVMTFVTTSAEEIINATRMPAEIA